MMMQSAPIPAHPVPDVIKETQPEEAVKEPEVETKVPSPSLSVTSPLEDLASVDRLFITKKLRVRTAFFLRGKKNRFFIKTPDQNLVYNVEELNRWWVGYFFYGLRPLQLKVTTSEGHEVMRIVRPYNCTSRIYPCFLQTMEVFSPPGTLIGGVEQVWSAIRPVYVVKDGDGDDVFWITGPRNTLGCFTDVEFHIVRTDGTSVGAVCKRWQGLLHALFTAPVTDRFGIAFEKDLSVNEKALLLAASLLIEYMYYDA